MTTETSAARPTVCPSGRPWRPSRIAGSSSPISTKTKPLRTNPIIFQLVSHRTRLFGVRIVPIRLPITNPAVTAASTPDETELIGGQVGRERDDDRDDDLDRRVVEPAQDLAGAPADDGPDRDPAERRDRETGDGLGQDEAPGDGGQRRPSDRRRAPSRR